LGFPCVSSAVAQLLVVRCRAAARWVLLFGWQAEVLIGESAESSERMEEISFWSLGSSGRRTSTARSEEWRQVAQSVRRLLSPNQALQPTAAGRCRFTFDFSHIAVVAGASASPAAVAELGR
jgi:hypothetical protein